MPNPENAYAHVIKSSVSGLLLLPQCDTSCNVVLKVVNRSSVYSRKFNGLLEWIGESDRYVSISRLTCGLSWLAARR